VSLDALETQIRADLAKLGYGAPTWVTPREGIHDVVIVGGGQSGLGAEFGLLRERIANILILDENPAGAEGPWDTYARMITLRTPKEITSIDGGIPSLTFRAYWEARAGTEAWAAIDKIPRGDWMDYLRWFRRVLALPVRNDARVAHVGPCIDGIHILRLADGEELRARKVILATGIQGGGAWHVPDFVGASLPRDRYAHTSQPIDFATLKGKRLAILGGGASAFDNAQHALGQGVASVAVFLRRAEMPRVNPIRFMEQSGLVGRFTALDDAGKYAVMRSFFQRNQPPTNDTFARAAAWPGFALHLGEGWTKVAEAGDAVAVETPKGHYAFDFLILSTGLVTDPKLRPELADLADDVLRWRDRYTPPEDANPLIDAHPYLGPGFELQGKDAAAEARLHGLFAFNYSALISLGLSAAALSGLKYAIPRLVEGVARQLFLDDRTAILAAYEAYAEEEFVADRRDAAA
jgi:cation diffusion facilitator CzcD-associated flavoprotein CzcO